jgi:hypothetical protein
MKELIVRSLLGGAALVLALTSNQSMAQLPVYSLDAIDYNVPLAVNVDNNLQTSATICSVPQFNTSGGSLVLDDVIITLTGAATYNNLILNNIGSSGSFTTLNTDTVANGLPVLGSLTATVTGPSGSVIALSGQPTSPAYGNSLTPIYNTTSFTLSSGSFDLSGYDGTGAIPVQFTYELKGPSGLVLNYASGTSTAGGTGSTFHIEYEYSPVPEASTVGLVAGLGCLVALFRRARH